MEDELKKKIKKNSIKTTLKITFRRIMGIPHSLTGLYVKLSVKILKLTRRKRSQRKELKTMKKFLDVNDIRICVDDTEKGDDVILLFHGLTGSKEVMYPLRDLLRDEYRVITVDARGHGESTRPKEYTLEDHARDVHEIIKQLGLQKANILGYSMGSYIALNAAELYCDDIDHLILACTKPNGKTSSVARILKEENLDITQVSQEEMMQVILKASVAPQTLEKINNGEIEFEEFFSAGESQELSDEEKAAEDASIANFDNSQDYDKVKCKTLVIGAEYDGINPHELGREVADGIEGAEFELISNSGHMVLLEKPDEFANVVKEFLKK